MNTIPWLNRSGRNGCMTLALIAILLAGLFLAGCDSAPKVNEQEKCDDQLNDGNWDKAIELCGAIETDEGHSKTAQAYMGRAGVSLLDVLASTVGVLLLILLIAVMTTSQAATERSREAVAEAEAAASELRLVVGDLAAENRLLQTRLQTVTESEERLRVRVQDLQTTIADLGLRLAEADPDAATVESAWYRVLLGLLLRVEDGP